MPLPKGVRSQGRRFRGYWNGKCGPSRTTVAAAKQDRDTLRAGLKPAPAAKALPRSVEKNRAHPGSLPGYRARRRLEGNLVQGPTRVTLEQAVLDAAEFAAAQSHAELEEKKQLMMQ